jgi:hypothetical protein
MVERRENNIRLAMKIGHGKLKFWSWKVMEKSWNSVNL